jgi:hypothetical protein
MRRLVLALALCVGAACGGDSGGDSGDHGDAPDDGGGGGDASGDAGGDPDAAPPSASCVDYCESIMASCTGDLAQYKFMPNCLASCALYPAGEEGADSGDSLACRLTHAALAEGEPDPHCRHAGPSGEGVCGEPCDAYCDLMMAVCDLYADDGECMEVCSGFPDTVLYSIEENRGDTVQCRLFHATMASAADGHCGTASAESGPCSAE